MNELDRRGALRLLLGGVILAGAGVSLWSRDAAALPEISPADHAAPGRREPVAGTFAQQTARPLPAPGHRPPHRPSPRHRRRRRWECWWHRGRRHCGWRWR
ncbi:hypothetical protein [Bradyrhizobium liaoningense]|uniref:hypothetical protein n=1 Tax=Bradyrhizobium liaoningense TaxID=43992 RepID=UPI001BAAF3DC|nr:hypothetical protein [Bradyrhizobium liaoningense]